MDLEHEEKIFIADAVRFLETPDFHLRLQNALALPVERAVEKVLPAWARKRLRYASEKALQHGLHLVTKTLPAEENLDFATSIEQSRNERRWHTLASFATGAIGGFFGFVSLPFELPVTTAIILRSVAAIARDYGMDLSDPEIQFECLYVLSLGSDRALSKAGESVYWASRIALGRFAREIAQVLAREGAKDMSSLGARLIAQVLTRFETIVGEKALAEALPLLGALSGGAINAAFTAHFATAAKYHFGLRALENRYGHEKIKALYISSREKTT